MLDRVTITGADDATDILEMLDLALSYPFLEWGILVSRSREGSPRYPSREWQERLLKYAHRMNLSMHVCGKWAREIFTGTINWSEMPPIKTEVERIQVNGSPADITYPAFPPVASGVQLIIQYPRAMKYLNSCRERNLNCVALFDESGGEGRQVRAWSDIPGCEYVGYAGGIGPEDVTETVGTIMAFRQGPFWIDSEGRMREDGRDVLSMEKTRRHLEVCDGIIHRPGFDGLVEAAERRQAERIEGSLK